MLKGIHDLGHHSSSPVSRFPAGAGDSGALVHTSSPTLETPVAPSKPGASPVIEGGGVSTPTRIQASGVPANSREIIAAIAAIRCSEYVQNSMLDAADLYAAMRVALRSADDAQILELLQVCVSPLFRLGGGLLSLTVCNVD